MHGASLCSCLPSLYPTFFAVQTWGPWSVLCGVSKVLACGDVRSSGYCCIGILYYFMVFRGHFLDEILVSGLSMLSLMC